MNAVNYDKATFSLALIDIDLFIESLQNLESSLKDATENMELILSHKDKELVPFLQKYSLSKFEEVRKCLKTMRSKVDKYRNKLITYFKKNLIAKDTFNLKVKELNELITENEKTLDEKIAKCNNYISNLLQQVELNESKENEVYV